MYPWGEGTLGEGIGDTCTLNDSRLKTPNAKIPNQTTRCIGRKAFNRSGTSQYVWLYLFRIHLDNSKYSTVVDSVFFNVAERTRYDKIGQDLKKDMQYTWCHDVMMSCISNRWVRCASRVSRVSRSPSSTTSPGSCARGTSCETLEWASGLGYIEMGDINIYNIIQYIIYNI